jgi:ribosomal protein L36
MSAKVRHQTGQIIRRSGIFYISCYGKNLKAGKQVLGRCEGSARRSTDMGRLGATAESRSLARPNQSALVGGDLLAANLVPYPAADSADAVGGGGNIGQGDCLTRHGRSSPGSRAGQNDRLKSEEWLLRKVICTETVSARSHLRIGCGGSRPSQWPEILITRAPDWQAGKAAGIGFAAGRIAIFAPCGIVLKAWQAKSLQMAGGCLTAARNWARRCCASALRGQGPRPRHDCGRPAWRGRAPYRRPG